MTCPAAAPRRAPARTNVLLSLRPMNPVTTGITRSKQQLRFPSTGVGFKISQNAASANTYIYSLEADVHEREHN